MAKFIVNIVGEVLPVCVATLLHNIRWKQFIWRRGQSNFHELGFQVHKSSGPIYIDI